LFAHVNNQLLQKPPIPVGDSVANALPDCEVVLLATPHPKPQAAEESLCQLPGMESFAAGNHDLLQAVADRMCLPSPDVLHQLPGLTAGDRSFDDGMSLRPPLLLPPLPGLKSMQNPRKPQVVVCDCRLILCFATWPPPSVPCVQLLQRQSLLSKLPVSFCNLERISLDFSLHVVPRKCSPQ
jgi:hypothetical protein